MRRVFAAASIMGILSGCATIPDVTYSYYPVKWSTVATVTQSVVCNADKSRLFHHSAASATTTYSSNTARPVQIRIKDLDRFFADSDMAMTFTDDGRLKSINQNSTGQGESLVKSAASLATTLGGIVSSDVEVATGDVAKQCESIKIWGGDKPVTLTYSALIDGSKLGTAVEVTPNTDSRPLYDLIQGALPKFFASVSVASESISGPRYDVAAEGASKDVMLVTLQKIATATLTVATSSAVISTNRIVIPLADTYVIPIPKPALFGKQTFSLVLSEAGAVTSIGYAKGSGGAGMLNAINSVASLDTASAKAADLRAQSDLIAQQQRLVLCKASKEQCK